VLLWFVAIIMLAASAVIIAFTVAQTFILYAAQATGGTVSPSFWMQLSWAIQSFPGVLLTVGLACVVAPFFLFAIAAQRPSAARPSAARPAADVEMTGQAIEEP